MSSDTQSRDDSAPRGRVAEDGTVYVRTADGERPVGSYPAGTPEEALEFFTKRFEALYAQTAPPPPARTVQAPPVLATTALLLAWSPPRVMALSGASL